MHQMIYRMHQMIYLQVGIAAAAKKTKVLSQEPSCRAWMCCGAHRCVCGCVCVCVCLGVGVCGCVNVCGFVCK